MNDQRRLPDPVATQAPATIRPQVAGRLVRLSTSPDLDCCSLHATQTSVCEFIYSGRDAN
jgi:hypothetical protein